MTAQPHPELDSHTPDRPGAAHDPTGHDLLTITEAADLLRAPVATLRYWRHLGTGPHSFRLGRRVLYRHDDLTAWIEQEWDQQMGDTTANRT